MDPSRYLSNHSLQRHWSMYTQSSASVSLVLLSYYVLEKRCRRASIQCYSYLVLCRLFMLESAESENTYEMWLTWAWKLLRTGATISRTSCVHTTQVKSASAVCILQMFHLFSKTDRPHRGTANCTAKRTGGLQYWRMRFQLNSSVFHAMMV